MSNITIDRQICIGCGACVALCTRQVFERRADGVAVINPARCNVCGHCIAVCPVDAITHVRLPPERCPPIGLLPNLNMLIDAFRARRSVRIYQDRPLSRDTIRQLVDLARWVPSAGNSQQVDWLVFDDRAQIKKLSDQIVALFSRAARWLRFPLLKPLWAWVLGKRVQSLLNSANWMEQQHAQGRDPIFFDAPALLIAHTRRGAPFGRDDAVYAAYNLMLGAQQMGLGSCQIGFFIVALSLSRKLRRMLGLPNNRQPQVAVVLGYPRYPFRRTLPRRQPEITWNSTAL